ncbi:MAG: NAD-dependent epimerase/dehydratase family protein [Acidobacteriota bacterium]
MRIFVAGSTGALGRRLVPSLIKAGHTVTGMTQQEAKAAELKKLGADAVVGDALDRSWVHESVAAARPEVVISQLTSLPQTLDVKATAAAYAANDRVRGDGTANVLDAAVEAGARRAIVQSIAYWYAPDGRMPRHEDAPFHVDAIEPVGQSVRVLKAMEEHAASLPFEVVLLRYGFLYGPGTWYGARGSIWQDVRQRRYPVIDGGYGMYSFIHVDDAAAATAAFVDRGAPGAYNIVDDEPAESKNWLPVYAAAIAASRPISLPRAVASIVARGLMEWERTIPPASNQKVKQELNWTLRYPSWRQGFRAGLS